MGIYCKAYYLRDLRAFSAWHERADQARPATESERAPRVLDDGSIVYVQSDLTVTDGIFLNDHVIFATIDAEWTRFCRVELRFEIPPDVLEAERMVAKDVESASVI